jgi:anti-sigma-K factor RskA
MFASAFSHCNISRVIHLREHPSSCIHPARFRVTDRQTRQSLKLIPLGSGEVPPAKAFQFWTKADKWKGPVSLGLVQPGRTLDVRLDKLPPLENNQLFEITLEPENGSPIDRPTGPILYIGRAVKVM